MMKGLGVRPDIISFNTLISACSYSASNSQAGCTMRAPHFTGFTSDLPVQKYTS